MNVLNFIIAQSGGQSPYASLIFLVLIIVVFYFFMIRPQMKKQKALKVMRESLKAGDKVVTSGGIFGKIVDLKDNAFLIEIAPEIRIKVDKASVFTDASEIPQAK